ncbi:MAG TPA: HD domain-containing phosphohydrolase [Chloroflexota bacterium]|nr:HD domain-containing phosphohydrolase [Chloroflexota bacterium]
MAEAAAVGTGARLVVLSARSEPHVLASVGCAHQPWISLALQVAESGQPLFQSGVVASPIHGVDDTLGAFLLYCDRGKSGFRGAYLNFARAFASHIEALLAASIERLAAMHAAADAMVRMLAAHDAATARHSRVVRRLARSLGVAIGLSPADLLVLELGALLHDVGKVTVPVEVLRKDGPLSPHEWAVMRQHPAIGDRIVREAPRLVGAAPAVRHHHERWDGMGYPDRLLGEAVPAHAQLVGLADAFEAMRVGRPYQAARSSEEALAELRLGLGHQFDPTYARILTALTTTDLVP